MIIKKTAISKIILLSSLFIPYSIFSQIPRHIPKPHNNNPIDLSSTADVIIYIALPLIALILFLIWRKKTKNKKR